MRFKRNKVWVAVDNQGRPIVRNKKVLLKYQLEQEHEYWVNSHNVVALDEPRSNADCPDSTPHPAAGESHHATKSERTKGAIRIYTDGACSGNPGPAGIGVVMQYRQHEKLISRHIGVATNNIAELEAVKAGLEAVKNPNLPVVVFTDSRYVLGLLTKGWNPKENRALVQQIKTLQKKFRNLQMVKVKGHSGHPENERADRLAVQALKKSGGGQTQE